MVGVEYAKHAKTRVAIVAKDNKNLILKTKKKILTQSVHLLHLRPSGEMPKISKITLTALLEKGHC